MAKRHVKRLAESVMAGEKATDKENLRLAQSQYDYEVRNQCDRKPQKRSKRKIPPDNRPPKPCKP